MLIHLHVYKHAADLIPPPTPRATHVESVVSSPLLKRTAVVRPKEANPFGRGDLSSVRIIQYIRQLTLAAAAMARAIGACTRFRLCMGCCAFGRPHAHGLSYYRVPSCSRLLCTLIHDRAPSQQRLYKVECLARFTPQWT